MTRAVVAVAVAVDVFIWSERKKKVKKVNDDESQWLHNVFFNIVSELWEILGIQRFHKLRAILKQGYLKTRVGIHKTS